MNVDSWPPKLTHSVGDYSQIVGMDQNPRNTYIYIYGSYGGFQKYLKIKLPRALQVMDDHDFVAEHPGRGRAARLAASAGGARVRFSWEKHRKQFGTAT